MSEPYYKTHEPPHCPTCDCGADPTEMEMLRRDAERYRFCVARDTMPVIAMDGKTWCMFVAVNGNRRSLFTGATPSEAIDAAMNGANA